MLGASVEEKRRPEHSSGRRAGRRKSQQNIQAAGEPDAEGPRRWREGTERKEPEAGWKICHEEQKT
eukprot:1174246-Heterocapsa_arctica.AAC.1